MASNRGVVVGAAWIYSAQLATIAVQFGYAAISSRSVDDAGFGAYAIALSVSGLIGLLANGGLGQTVARMQTLERETLQSLFTFGVILGAGAAALLLATADLWAWVWGAPDAAAPTRWCALGAFVAPTTGLSSGLLRRQGRFRSLAIMTLATNILGFLLGAIAVLTFHSAESLLVSPLAAQVALATTLVVLSPGYLRGLSPLRAARTHLTFSVQVTAQNLGSWPAANIGQWAISRLFTSATLGQWNRADVLTTVPFYQVQTAMVQAVYPEFRYDLDGPTRARHVWPDLLGLVAWLAFPLSGAAAVIAPVLIPILFGDGWGLAAAFSSVLAVIAGVRMVRMVLGAAVEALGRYLWVWTAIGVEFAFTLTGVLTAIVAGDYWLIFVGIGVGVAGAHIANVIACARADYLDVRVLIRHYAGAIVAGLGAAGISWLIVVTIAQIGEMPWLLGGSAIVLLGGAGGAWRWRRHLPPVKLAQKYGLLASRRSAE